MPLPPETERSTEPLFPPLHVMSVPLLLSATGAGAVNVAEAVVEQPLPSDTVAVYVPGAKPVICHELELNPPGPLQETVYGVVPPAGVSTIDPSVFPLQLVPLPPAKLPATAVAVSTGGATNVVEDVTLQPFWSVTVKV